MFAALLLGGAAIVLLWGSGAALGWTLLVAGAGLLWAASESRRE